MKNAKPIAIHLDRLAAALAEQGVALKRSQLLEVAAAAFGHRASNETSKLSATGVLTPPSAQPIGRIDLGEDSVMLVRDAGTDLPYAIAQSFLDAVADDRSKHFAPTPYGGLADLRRVAISEVPPLSAGVPVARDDEDWRAVIQTGYGFHGHTFFHANSASALATEIASWCVEHWDSARDRDPHLPSRAGRSRLTDLEVIQGYFEAFASIECLLMEDQESLTDIIEALRNGIAEEGAPRPAVARSDAFVRDGRFRAYPRTSQPSDMPEEKDYLSSHDTLAEAIAACQANAAEYQDSAVADHVARKYWRASYGWKPQDMPELAVSDNPDITTFHLDAKDLVQNELADELRRLGDMIDDGYNQGETKNRGWSGHPEMDPDVGARWQPPEGMPPCGRLVSSTRSSFVSRTASSARMRR
ncbi:hypothetical protein [Sphingomonas sp. 3-13AW]|uniref:hypothetical protein n=1 Tax=Sphingomonas sp. 3-13AW TaxID=3050450 RepID=UPI003BB5B5C2